MNTTPPFRPTERYTILSDRFRSLWTFYQFLGGVFKHQDRGKLPFSYDFQSLYKRMQDIVPGLANASEKDAEKEINGIERELAKIHAHLRTIEEEFAPSLLRRLFDHLKQQDEKILVALVKFYLQYETYDEDTLDKLDILLTRLAQAPGEGERVLPRSDADLRAMFERLAEFAGIDIPDAVERSALLVAIREFRSQIEQIPDFDAILAGGIYDRYRNFKHKLGSSFLDPEIAVELVKTNIAAKNRFQELYKTEETGILEDTNRIFEIERYLEKNPDAADTDLRLQIEAFKRFRGRFDEGRKEDNIRRDVLAELRRSVQEILQSFDPPEQHAPYFAKRAAVGREADLPAKPPPVYEPPAQSVRSSAVDAIPFEDQDEGVPQRASSTMSLDELVPPDTLLNESLHKIMFALELVIWDHPPERAVTLTQLNNLKLEPWEADAYRRLAGGLVAQGTHDWDLAHFLLTTAALRVKMDEEDSEILRLQSTNSGGRLFEVLERSAQSLERAGEVEKRFHWFLDDMLYRGHTEKLDQLSRSRFRFLKTYAALWLDHQNAGGVTPL
ncbi:MAG: hypothetical protein GXP48_05450 [Acidobacteria bacterium]|nr:hypothetical protein [Acidobacteriota bacterium]